MISKTMISENMILQVMIMILQIMIVKRKENHSHMDHAAAMIHGLTTWPAAVHCVYGLRPAAPPAPRAASCQQPPEKQQRQPYIRQPESGNRREAPSPDPG
jgi:hypothetical protein